MSDVALSSLDVGRVRPRRGIVALVGLVFVVGLLWVAVSSLSAALSRVTPAEPAPLPAVTWLEIPKPVQIFSLQAAGLSKLPFTYSARRLSVGEVREDVLAFGTLASAGPGLRLNLLRMGSGASAPTAFFTALVREAAGAGLAVDRSGLPTLISTRFGRFEIADVTLMGRGDSISAKVPCSGFRLLVDKPMLSMTGLACGTTTAPLERQDLACLIDRLDLASAGEDRAMVEFFAAAELKRNIACSGARLGPDGVHAPWLDDKPVTSRKSLRRR